LNSNSKQNSSKCCTIS